MGQPCCGLLFSNLCESILHDNNQLRQRNFFYILGHPIMNLYGARNCQLNQTRLNWPADQNLPSEAISHQSAVWNHGFFSRIRKGCAQLSTEYQFFHAPKQQKLYYNIKKLCFSVRKTVRFHSLLLLCPRHLKSDLFGLKSETMFFALGKRVEVKEFSNES